MGARRGRAAWLAGAWWVSTACAHGEGVARTEPPPEPEVAELPEPPESELDLTALALLASGYEDEGRRRAARQALDAQVGPIVEAARGLADREAQARAILELLFAPSGLLKTYDARATTLADVLDRGDFNCVSATVLFNLIADAVGLESEAQLLPTHARSRVRLPGRVVVVETTSALGFDPGAEDQRAILARVAGAVDDATRTIVSGDGVTVSNIALMSVIYVNRASIAQEAGDLATAERLFGRGESMAPDARMRSLLRDQRAALLAQLGVDDITSGDPSRLRRGFLSAKTAATLNPADPRIRASVLRNLRAAAERYVAHVADTKDERLVYRVVSDASTSGLSPEHRAGLRAFALAAVARLRMARGEVDAALAAIDQAMLEPLVGDDAPLRETLERNRVAVLCALAQRHAADGEYDETMAVLDRLESTVSQDELRAERLKAMLLLAEKSFVEQRYDEAISLYREGIRIDPSSSSARQNLLVALQHLAARKLEEGRCADAEPNLAEISALDPTSQFPGRGRSHCLVARAEESARAGDLDETLALLEKAIAADPSSEAARKNRRLVLRAKAERLARQGQCREAERLLAAAGEPALGCR